jgi:Predicted Zn-dependent hydrolases of the beta-lactamase fold
VKITKYNQSCLLVEAKGKRILVDPGEIDLSDQNIDGDWTRIDAIFVTHRHFDHCSERAIKAIVERDNSQVYTTTEVSSHCKIDNLNIVKDGDRVELDGTTVEVVRAEHGFLVAMKYSDSEIKENVGFIIDDGDNRLLHTSDTIGFNSNYKCTVLAMPFNGNGLTFGIVDGVNYARDVSPKIVLPIHMQHPNPIMNPDVEKLKTTLESQDLNYRFLSVGESIEF